MDQPSAVSLHHVELWVPYLARAVQQWGWLLGRLGYESFQDWPDGRSGRAIFLTDGILRARYRNSLAEPEPLTPGEPYELSLDLSITSNVFRPGHRIRLEVSSSNFPRYDRNSNTGGVIAEESASEVTVAVNRVRHGPAHPSRLILPVIRR